MTRDIRFEPGDILAGRYQIEVRLGGGAQGEVFRAFDQALKKPVALKFLPKDAEGDPEKLKQLLHEVRMAQDVTHPNVLRIYDVVEADGRYFVSMELIEGWSLASLLRVAAPLPLSRAVSYADALCQGLDAMHTKDVLHRDLKPENVMIDRAGGLRLADFGLALHTERWTVTKQIVGTPEFMAPEQFDAQVSVRSDIYAVGLILYEMFTGHRAFPVNDKLALDSRSLDWFFDLKRRHQTVPPTQPTQHLPGLEPTVERIILRCLAKDPWQRFASALAVTEALQATRPLAPLAPDTDDTETLPLKPELEDALVLDAWLHCLQAEHETLLPFFEKASDVLLDEVYVELRLEPVDFERHAGEGGNFPAPEFSLRQALELDPAVQPWVTRRWFLRGDPGAGKTTLLRHLAFRLAGDSERPWVPLFESLPRWIREPGSLFEHADARLAKSGHPAGALRHELERLAKAGRLLLLLDGLDEVPAMQRREAEDALRTLAQSWPDTPIVVTSRPIGVERPHRTFVEMELVPFDAGRRRTFLARWLGRLGDGEDREGAEALAAVLETDFRLEELAGNPLHLTLMALLYESGTQPQRNRARLYDQVFDLLYEGRHRQPPRPLPNRNAAHRALRHLAYGMTWDNLDNEPLRNLEERLRRPEAEEVRRNLESEESWRLLNVFFADVAEFTGIIGPHDGRDASWRFWHRTFREALAAEALEYELGDVHRPGILRNLLARLRGEASAVTHANGVRGHESRWAEPYALLVGRTADPDSLVLALIRENRELGLRAVATADGLSDETLLQVLKLSGNWKQRRKVFEQIPRFVTDPERALALVDRLRRSTRDGNDLFFLERTTSKIGRKDPQAERLASRLRDRFFDHVPVPPAELFQWVETPLDGRVALWCEIPAGSFLMGSPEGEGDNDERPRHTVEITAPLRMAAVPVTNAQYAAFDPDHAKDASPDHPVRNVSFFAAAAFCRWLSQSLPEMRCARLPTEEEWEYACRAGTATRYWSGDTVADLARVGWYLKNSGSRTHPVGEKPANPWGLYDVHGNTWEWTLSEFTASGYSGREAGFKVDPSVVSIDKAADLAAVGGRPACRGGSALILSAWARGAFRAWGWFGLGHMFVGLRVVLPPLPPPRDPAAFPVASRS